MGKGICYDISGTITENLINNESPKEDPLSPKDDVINEDKEEISHEEDKQETSNKLPQDWTIVKDHPLDQILGDIKRGVSARSQVNNLCNYSAFISQIKPKTISIAYLMRDGYFLYKKDLSNLNRTTFGTLFCVQLIKPSLVLDGYLGIKWMKIA